MLFLNMLNKNGDLILKIVFLWQVITFRAPWMKSIMPCVQCILIHQSIVSLANLTTRVLSTTTILFSSCSIKKYRCFLVYFGGCVISCSGFTRKHFLESASLIEAIWWPQFIECPCWSTIVCRLNFSGPSIMFRSKGIRILFLIILFI